MEHMIGFEQGPEASVTFGHDIVALFLSYGYVTGSDGSPSGAVE
jgi:hypothetical protein